MKHLVPLSLALAIALSGCAKPSGEGVIKEKVEEMQQTVDTAERITAETFLVQLNSAAQGYMLKTGQQPQSFADFVTAGPIPPDSNYTISLQNLGREGSCTVQPQVLDCGGAFTHYDVKYRWQGSGQSVYEIQAK